MKAVIQAGGKGTRVSSLTGGVIPKLNHVSKAENFVVQE